MLYSITGITNTNQNPTPLILLQEEVNFPTFRKTVRSLVLAKTTATLNSHPQESTFGEASFFPLLPPCSWPTPPASTRKDASKILQRGSILCWLCSELCRHRRRKSPDFLALTPNPCCCWGRLCCLLIAVRHPLILLIQTHDFPLQGRPWAACVMEGSCATLAGRAQHPHWQRKSVQNPHDSHLDCETKNGDVRKCGVCRHPATLALPPCACTAMAPCGYPCPTIFASVSRGATINQVIPHSETKLITLSGTCVGRGFNCSM